MSLGPDDEEGPERDDGPDDRSPGPVPAPADRPWFHPSELSSFVPAPPPAQAAPPSRREWVIGATSALAATLITVMALVAFGALGERNPRVAGGGPGATAPGEVVDAFVASRVYQGARPSVVSVRVEGASASTGVAYSSNRVLASATALGGATSVTVVTVDDRTLPATVIGVDRSTDLALLRVADNANLRPVHLGTSDDARLGQALVLVAVTGGAQPWVSTGVLGATNAMVGSDADLWMVGLLRSDVERPAGTTGGALLDTQGHLVGILAGPETTTGGALAVTVEVARDVAQQLDASGRASHGWLGLTCTDSDVRSGRGALVQRVVPGSPAAVLRPGTTVAAVDDQSVSSAGELYALIRRHKPGDPVELRILDGARTSTVRITLGARDATGDPTVMGTG
jgi:putative serine protease PepD